MELGGKDADAIRQYARDRSIDQIAWINSDTTPTIETVGKSGNSEQ